MPAYTNIANALVAVGAKPFATTMQGLRDNPLAIAEADSTAPVNQSAWHPFNKVTVGDSNTGQIWGFTANGAVAAVTSPDFVDGFDYGFLIANVSLPASRNLRVNLFLETNGAYAGPRQISNSSPFLGDMSGWIELPFVRRSLNFHFAWGVVSNAAPGAPTSSGNLASPAQKILRAQFTLDSGNITGTAASFIYMYRRRSI